MELALLVGPGKFLLDHGLELLALILSFILFYRDYLKRFKLELVSAGRVTITKNPFSPGVLHACLFIDLLFYNHGATNGTIKNMAVCLHDGDKKILLVAWCIIADRTKRFEKDPQFPQMESFISFQIRSRESFVKQIVFAQQNNAVPYNFEEKNYKADIYVLTAKSNKWKCETQIDFSIDRNDIETLSKIVITPQSNNGYMVNWLSQDKQTLFTEKNLQNLKAKIGCD